MGTSTGSGGTNEASCVEGVNCDTFRLTVAPGDYTGKALAVRISWGIASNNYDLYLHKAPTPASTNAQANATAPIAQSRTSGAGTRESVVMDPGVFGAGDYTVHIVYVAGSGTDQYHGVVAVVAQTPDIAATMTDAFPSHSDGKAHEGDTIDYSVTITNNGGATANGPKLNDPAPANTTDVAGSVRMSALATNDSYSVNFNSGLNVPAPGVLGNDKGIPLPSAVPIASGTTTAGGTVTLNADGSFAYTPQPNFGGTDSFSYTATNVQPPNDSATVTVKVNQLPTNIALSNSSVDENRPAGTDVGTLSTTDPDAGDTHTYSLVAGAGSTDNSSFQINGAILKTAAPLDFETKASYSVRVQTDDGHGGTFAKQFTITANNINEAPTATDQAVSTNEDTPLAVTLTGTDPEADSLTFSHDATSTNGGTITGSGASVTYTPASQYSGSDTFGFTVDDGHGHTDTGTITIIVNSVNDAPVAQADSYTTNEDTPLTVAAPGVLANDSDVDSPTITAVLVTGPANATSFALNSNGSFNYTPVANYNGSDSFTYKANDGSLDSNTVTVSLTINAVNDSPTATDQAGLTTNEDTALPITLAGTDPDGDSLTFAVDQPAHGSISPTNSSSVTYTPNANYCGPDSFTFHTNDASAQSANGTISITVNCLNDPPSFTKGGDQTVNEDASAQTVPGWATAISAGPADESGQTVTFVVTNNTNAALFSAGPAVAANGTLTYALAANANGSATITLKLTDSGGAES
ncbi:MAG: large repetitive protein, partial [Verrucomicrobiota bacterium]